MAVSPAALLAHSLLRTVSLRLAMPPVMLMMSIAHDVRTARPKATTQ